MKLVVTCRALNEEDNIDHYCQNYSFCDKILLLDGGSTDKTVEKALKYKNVEVRENPYKHYLPNGDFMNPEALTMQYLFDWGKEEDPDWIMHDGCDSVPTKAFQRDVRELLKDRKGDFIFIKRIYFWMHDQWFPRMGKGYCCNGYRPTADIYWDTTQGPLQPRLRGCPVSYDQLDNPYALLHDGWPTEEVVKFKLQRYSDWGMWQQHPLEAYGPPAKREEWMK